MSYILKQKMFMDGKIRIPGEMYIPDEGQKKYPTVIYSHGLGAGRGSAYKYLDTFEKHGLAAVCFDFPGGGSNNEQVRTTDMSVMTELDNLRAVMDEVMTLDFTDDIILMGSSQGGLVSALLAAERPELVKTLIITYPAFVIPDMIRSTFTSLDVLPEDYEHPFMTIGRRYGEDVWNLDVYSEISGYGKDVLIIHGDRDEVVPVEYSKRALSAYENAELHIIEGAVHGFEGEYVTRANEILDEYLTKKGL